MKAQPETGATLAEMLAILAIIGIFITGEVVAVARMAERAALRQAAAHVRAVLIENREYAELLERGRGVKFRPEDAGWSYSIHEDGDGDGVRNADIDAGVDPLVQRRRTLLAVRGLVMLGPLPPGTADPDTGKDIPPGAPAVQFNTSTICACSRTGDCTPGTVYLTSRGGESVLVRSSGEDGNVRVAYYDPVSRKWQ